MARFEELTVGQLHVLKGQTNHAGSLNMRQGAEIIFPNPYGGQDYFVDGNRAASGDGTTWGQAYATLQEAIAASDVSIALTANRWWARRNRIFVCADALTANLVKFPTKCDVIGVGSYDGYTQPGIIGRHLPVGESYGTRFFNIHFKGIAHASAIITITSVSSGMQFHGCTFDATAGTLTSAILCTASPFLQVVDCDFMGTFATSFISFGTGEAGRARILNNRMLGVAAKGIVCASGMTASWMPLIDGNILKATGLTIDDDSDLFFVTNNRLITDANIGTTTAGYDFNLAFASGNILTGLNGIAASIPFEVAAE